MHRILAVTGGEHIHIGNRFYAKEGLRLEAVAHWKGHTHHPTIRIGDRVIAGAYLHIGCIDAVSIGDATLIGSFVTITDHSHGDPALLSGLDPTDEPLVSKGPVIIGKRCRISDGVVILGGVMIGDDCVIGGNSIVNRSLPSGTVCGGMPAKVLKQRVRA